LTSFSREASTEGTADVAEDTAFGDNSKTYIAGQKDGTLTAGGIYDAAAGASAQVLESLLGTADAEVSYLPEGDAVGKRGYGLLSIPTQFSVQSPVDDIVAWSAEAQSSVGKEPVLSLHALGAETVSGNGTGQDNAASSADGASAYLQVSAVAGTTPSLIVKVQHSVDNSVWVDLITFDVVTAASDNTSQRKKVSGTVNRYLRFTASDDVAGPLNAVFLVVASRNPGN